MIINSIVIFFISMLPVIELRGAIPIALGAYDMPVFLAYTISVIGNLVPVFFILMFFEKVALFLSKYFKIIEKFLIKLIERTRNKHSKRFEYLGAAALITFVAIPLPFTGAWTGALATIVFGIPYKKAFAYISAGVLIAGIIVTLLTLSIV